MRTLCAVFLQAIADTGRVSEALAAHGVSHHRRDFTSVAARLLAAHKAMVLDISGSQPVYEPVGGNLDKRGEVFQASTAIWRADRVFFEF